jgi:hypothetical protein
MLDLVLDVLRQDADLQTQNGGQDGAKQLLDQGKEDAASVFLAVMLAKIHTHYQYYNTIRRIFSIRVLTIQGRARWLC